MINSVCKVVKKKGVPGIPVYGFNGLTVRVLREDLQVHSYMLMYSRGEGVMKLGCA